MTNEELEKELQGIIDSIESLPESNEPLSKEETKNRQVLQLKKETLEKIKEAREKSRRNDEMYNSMVYAVLNSWGPKHPYLMWLVLSMLRWNTV